MIYLVVIIIVMCMYIMHLNHIIRSLKKRIERLNRDSDDDNKIFDHQSMAIMELEDENEDLRQRAYEAEIWNSLNESLNK